MLKVTIKGETFSFDEDRYLLPEAIEIEEAAGMPFGQWQSALAAGSAKAVAILAWVVMKRDGRDVPLADILSGKYELATTDFDAQPEGTPAEPGPTSGEPSGSGSPLSPSSTDTPPLTSAP